jgi:hypothetical protein
MKLHIEYEKQEQYPLERRERHTELARGEDGAVEGQDAVAV